MKKKVLVLLVVAALAILPATAADYRGTSKKGEWGVGLNLGTNTGVALKYGYGDFDIFGTVGFDFLNLNIDPFQFSVGLDVGVTYQVYDIDLGGKHHMPVTVGFMIPVGFVISEGNGGFNVNLGVVVLAGLEYEIPTVPLEFYLKAGVGPGFKFGGSGFDMYPAWSAGLGILYKF